METALFILSKLVGLALRVETWLVILALLSALGLLLRRQRLALGASLSLLVALIVLSLLPLGDLLMQPLERRYPIDPPLSDVAGIIVLGGAEDAPRSAYWHQMQLNQGAERFTAALALARRFPQAKIVFTGGSGRLRDLASNSPREASVAGAFFRDQGVRAERLLVDAKARNTSENARNALALARPVPGSRWVLVTSAFHMPRAMSSFERAGWQGVLPWPVDFRSGRFVDDIAWSLPDHLDVLDTAIREWVGVVAYRFLGR
ncbi:YdcF family protein [Thioclava sp.]|uniref:YdcF family protein n=1 Tax=Thioclava sp. TaxID=1933450 RepID=UPI003AA83ACF